MSSSQQWENICGTGIFILRASFTTLNIVLKAIFRLCFTPPLRCIHLNKLRRPIREREITIEGATIFRINNIGPISCYQRTIVLYNQWTTTQKWSSNISYTAWIEKRFRNNPKAAMILWKWIHFSSSNHKYLSSFWKSNTL